MFSWFENRINPYPAEVAETPPKSLLKFCLHYCNGIKKWLALMAICTAAVAGIEVSLFSTLGNVVDWLSVSNRQHFFVEHKFYLLSLTVMTLIVLPAIIILQNLIIRQTLVSNFPLRIRWSIHKYLLGQSMSYFQKLSSGRICAKIMQTSLAVRETVMKMLDVFNYILVYFTGTLILAAQADWRIMLAFIGWAVAYSFMLLYFIPKLRSASREQADASAMMTGRIVDAYTNITTVKLFSHNDREENYAKEGLEKYRNGANKQMRLISQFSMAIYFLNCLLLFAVTAMGIVLWQKSILAVGAVAVGIGLAMRLNSMAQWIMWEMSALFENIGIVQDGINSISVEREIEDKNIAKLDVKEGAIEFKNVSFGYNKNCNLFNDFNLNIKPGEKIGIVGRSGSGKSSLINMLLRFYETNQGDIFIDGQNIAEVSQESLRSNIALVSQDTSLLNRSIKENIVYGKPDANDGEIVKAMKSAEAFDFVQNLSDSKGNIGLTVSVGERGANLSGGQRQRIAISRVLLKDAPILILDEATSALDTEAETAIQNSLSEMMQGKTVLAIAHRLSTIAKMDRLLVIDKGKIVEDGAHQELLAKGGIYASLWNQQSGGELILEQAA